MELSFGYFRTDESSHNYLVPEEIIRDFDADMDNLDHLAVYQDGSNKFHAACNEFDQNYGQYRIDGLGEYRIVIP